MQIELKDKWALVTGSSRGIGKAIAGELAEAGANVILCARGTESLGEAAAAIGRFGHRVESYRLASTGSQDINRLFTDIVAPLGRLDILVNNVGGVEKFGSFLDLSDDDWRASWDLNFMSMVHFCRAAIPWLQKSSSGRIINISSVPARQPGFFNPHYSASKAAMLNLNKHLANFLAKDNILVNAVCPSTLKGGGWEKNIEDRAVREGISYEEAARAVEGEENKKVPLGRIGKLEDVSRLVTFLSSPMADFVTGTCIDVDGGTVRSVF